MTKSSTPIRIVLADDHEIFRDGFRVMLRKQPSVQLVAEASNGIELIEKVRQFSPDVVVTDINMPHLDGIEATHRLIDEFPTIKIVALSMHDQDNLIIEMLEAGAKGYLLKNAHKEEIIAAIKAAYADENYYCSTTTTKLAVSIGKSKHRPARKVIEPVLTEREKIVMCYICSQMSNKEIAQTMNLSVRTIEGYREAIFEKIKVRNIAGMVVYAVKNKIYQPD